MRSAVSDLAQQVGTNRACTLLAYPRSSYYRQQCPPTPKTNGDSRPQPASPRALSAIEREKVRETLNSERFVDCSPRQVYGTLLDEEIYLCSVSTMYRILAKNQEVRERRNQKKHPAYTKPELVATAPNQVWTWDITNTSAALSTSLRGPVTHVYYYLYTILDIFSRYVVGYMIAERELAYLAKQLVADSCAKQHIVPDQLILHADRGSSMTSKTLALLLADTSATSVQALGVDKSHSRPYVSNDNPYSEAQFKTMKYRPDYPDRFGCLVDARTWAQPFFDWYNNQHRHVGLGLMTPATVHYGLAEDLTAKRQVVLAGAYAQHPERFVKGRPMPPQLPDAVWINPPQAKAEVVPSS
jgi:putative transposase